MEVSFGRNINYKNTLNEKSVKLNLAKKFNIGNNNKNNNSKFSNSRKEIYERKNLMSNNTENNIEKQKTNDYQSPKIKYQNNNKIFKNNNSEVNIYNKSNQNNNKNIKLIREKKNNNEINKLIIINNQADNKQNKNNFTNSSNFNTDNNTLNTITNSNNSKNSNTMDNINKPDFFPKNKKNTNNIANNLNTNKNYDFIEINNKGNLKKSYQIKSDYRDKFDNNHSTNNIHNYCQTNTGGEIKINTNKNINNNHSDNKNYYLSNNLNKMINSVNIDNNDKEKLSNRLKKNISIPYENFNLKNSFKINKNENENNNFKILNEKNIIININNKNNKNIIIKKNDNKIRDKISPNNQNNYINKVKTNGCGTSSNYKEKTTQPINTKQIIVSPQINEEKKYKANYKDKNENIRKNLSINICEKDIITTPISKNINLINKGNNTSSYTKSVSGSSSHKKYNNINDRIISIKNSNYKNDNDYINKNKGRILMNTNDITKLNQLASKTEENNLLNRINKGNNKNFKYFYNINDCNTTKNENEGNKKDYSLYISPDKYNNIQETKKQYNNISGRITSSAKSKNSENKSYLQNKKEENNLILNNNGIKNIKISYPYKSSIFQNSPDSNNINYNISNEYKKEDNYNFKIRINKNISNFSNFSKTEQNNEIENEIEQFNISERIIKKDKKKIGTDSRTKINKKNDLKIAYSPNIIKNYNLNKNRINEINIKTTEFFNKNIKNNNIDNKIPNFSVNNTNNYISNNIILNKNNNFYMMNNINNNNDYLEKSIDSFQKKDITTSSIFNNKIYKKRNTNEKIIINSNYNDINNKPFPKSPYLHHNFNNYNVNNQNNNIYDFDTPLQNNPNLYINNNTANNRVNDINFQKNIRINTPLTSNNLLSERYLEENNKKFNEHPNNFINIKKKTINNKSNDLKEIRNNKGSPKIYVKKFDYSKNRPFNIHRENKINNNKEYKISNEELNLNYNNKELIYSNKNEKEIQNIYNEQKNSRNEIKKVNNFEFNMNKKNNIIKPPIVIDENKKDKKEIKNSIDNKIENKNITEGNININKNRLRLNKEKIHLAFNETKPKKDIILNKPINKISFKSKFYFYNIKKYIIKGCYYSKIYKPKNQPDATKDKEKNNSNINNSFKQNKKLNLIIDDNIISNEQNNEITFTEKIPVLIDNNLNSINNEELFIIESSFKENKIKKNINETTSNSNFKITNEMKVNNIKSNNSSNNNTLSKNSEKIVRSNRFNNQKNNDKEDLEMTFGIEEIINNQSKINNNNNQFDANSNINNFSTINNNTNHSIVINEYINSNTNNNTNFNNINENINNNLIYKENNIQNVAEQINDYLDDEEVNQNEDFQILSEEEDEEIKKEEENHNSSIYKNNNNIMKRNEDKILHVTEGKEISGEIPDKINKGIKLLELFQIRRNSKNEFNNEGRLFNSNDNNEIIDYNYMNEKILLFNNEKRNYIFENELLNDDDFYKKKMNTFKPKKSNKLFENLTKDKKCEILNDILTDIFDKKEKENTLYFNDLNSRSKTPLSNRNKSGDNLEKYNTNEEKYLTNNNIIDNKKNTYNPKKIERYSKIFNLNTIKNLEEILNKKRSNKIFDFINIDEIDDEFKSNRGSVLTYNKKLKNKDKDEILLENDFLSNSNKKLEINNSNKNYKKYNNINNNIFNFDAPKFNKEERNSNKFLKNKKIYSYEEILNYNKMNNICSKENFLTEEVISHCNLLLNYVEIQYIKTNFAKKDNKRRWNKIDLSKEIKEAEEYVKKMNIEMKKDNYKFEIIEILNTITVDNYKEILNKLSFLIYEIDNQNYNNIKIKPEILLDKQYRFAEIIIDKAIMEKGYVKLYAMLCYDLYLILNKIIDNYLDKNIKNQLYTGENLKSLLVGECKQRFIDYQYSNNVKDNDLDIIFLIKKKFLGNINFIVELISVKLFSQKIGFDTLDLLYQNYKEKKISDENKYLNLEGIITLLNKFGKIIFERKNEKFLQNLNNYMNDYIIPLKEGGDKGIPNHLKYKIINLIEKQKNNWEESLYEKSITAKGKNTNIIKSSLNNEEQIINVNINNINEVNDKNNNNYIILNNKNNKNNYDINYSESKSEIIKLKIKKINYMNKNNSMELSFKETIFNSLDNSIEKDKKISHENEVIDEEKIINLLKKDFRDFISFSKRKQTKNNASYKFFEEDYDWIIIDNLILKNNIKLDEIICCIIEIFIDLISKDNIFYGNQYIINVVNYYLNISDKNEIKILHNKMNDLILNIENIILENNNMFEILGNLFFVLINKKLLYIKDFNCLVNSETTTIINISKVIKNIIIASDIYKKIFYINFKNLELFNNNDIFDKFITIPLNDYYGYEIEK